MHNSCLERQKPQSQTSLLLFSLSFLLLSMTAYSIEYPFGQLGCLSYVHSQILVHPKPSYSERT